MYELYRRVSGIWEYYGTYDLADDYGIKEFTKAVWQLGSKGFLVRVEGEEEWNK